MASQSLLGMAHGYRPFKSGRDNNPCLQNSWFLFLSCLTTPSSPVQYYVFFLGFFFLIFEVVLALHIPLSIPLSGVKAPYFFNPSPNLGVAALFPCFSKGDASQHWWDLTDTRWLWPSSTISAAESPFWKITQFTLVERILLSKCRLRKWDLKPNGIGKLQENPSIAWVTFTSVSLAFAVFGSMILRDLQKSILS